MATSIEIGKLAATLWLHRNYRKESKTVVLSLIFLVVMAMFITSGGVYGYLTGGHAGQEAPIEDTRLRVERIDNRIKSLQEAINRDNARLIQLDGVVQKLIDYDKISGPGGARAVRQEQQEERDEIQQSIDNAYKHIDKLRDERLELSQSMNLGEAKLGPVRYLAGLLNLDTTKAVMYFTLILVLLLDPFAVLLLIATSISYHNYKSAKEKPLTQEIIGVDSNVREEEIQKSALQIDIDQLSDDEITALLENEVVQNNLASNPDLLNEIEDKIKTGNKSKVTGWYDRNNPLPRIKN